MEEIVTAVVAKLDASSLLLAIVLVGGGWIAKQILPSLMHVERISESMKSIAEDTSELRRDMSRIAEKVAVHEVRLDSLERNRD